MARVDEVTGKDQQRRLLEFIASSVARPGGDEPMVVVPSLRHPRFIVPVRTSMLAARSLLSHNAMRTPATRAQRLLVAALFRAGAGAALSRERLDRVVVESDSAAEPLIDHLSVALGIDDLTFAVGLARFGPDAKPVLQLFDGEGRSVGFAKVGWTDASAALVTNEAGALTTLAAADHREFHQPQVMSSTVWNGMPVLVTSPLPSNARHAEGDDIDLVPAVTELAAVDGELGRGEVGDLAVVDRLARSDLEVVATAAARVIDRHGQVTMSLGRAHGDLTSWNLALARTDLWVWDWEYSAPGVALGVDLVHARFQDLAQLQRRPLPTSLRWSARAAEGDLCRLGLDRHQRRAVVDLHRLELLDRAMATSGATNVAALARILTNGDGR